MELSKTVTSQETLSVGFLYATMGNKGNKKVTLKTISIELLSYLVTFVTLNMVSRVNEKNLRGVCKKMGNMGNKSLKTATRYLKNCYLFGVTIGVTNQPVYKGV